MKRLFSQLHRPLRNERGEITFFACFFVVGVVMLISFLLLYASVRITCINIRNGAKMELNNLSATIYADTYRSQRETNFEEYLRTLYSSRDYTEMLEATVAGGLAEKVPLSTDDYTVSDISLEFNVVGDRVEYIFYIGASAAELRKEALQLHIDRVFDNPQWGGYLPFNKRYRPEVWRAAHIVYVRNECCHKISPVTQEQIDHAYNGTIPCPHCGRWSEFIVLGIRLQPEPLVPCLNCDCHDPDIHSLKPLSYG